jgi:hypothetical protein
MTVTSSSRAGLSTTSTEDRGSGIAPIAPAARRLGAIQLAVLWGDLAVGVLVMAAGGTMVAPTDAGGLGSSPPPATIMPFRPWCCCARFSAEGAATPRRL